MKTSPKEKAPEAQKGPGGQDAVNSGRSELGQKKEPVNFGYENGISKPDAQQQSGENPDEDERNKEWQERARTSLEQTSSDTITNIEQHFNDGDDKTPERDAYY